MIEQFDISGETHALEAFEPQMEGQLALGDDDGEA